jgi:hypothetical protein
MVISLDTLLIYVLLYFIHLSFCRLFKHISVPAQFRQINRQFLYQWATGIEQVTLTFNEPILLAHQSNLRWQAKLAK